MSTDQEIYKWKIHVILIFQSIDMLKFYVNNNAR